jgi:hypothetical protein
MELRVQKLNHSYVFEVVSSTSPLWCSFTASGRPMILSHRTPLAGVGLLIDSDARLLKVERWDM